MKDCFARLENDVLTIGNSKIVRTFSWNGGNLISTALADLRADQRWELSGKEGDFQFGQAATQCADGKLDVTEFASDGIRPAHMRAEISYRIGILKVRRVFRIYPECPAIGCDIYLSGKVDLQGGANIAGGDLKNIENGQTIAASDVPSVMDRLCVGGKHWRVRAVEFLDATDWNNSLVNETRILSYRQERRLTGNLLHAFDVLAGHGIFMLKESPCSNVQLASPGFDFTARIGELRAVGMGVSPADISEDGWTRAYGCVVGVCGPAEFDFLSDLRSYQKNLRIHKPARDEMILMNTWGDRGQDSRVCEKFTLNDLEIAARLGVTHFQIDDGWQVGRSCNSAVAGGSLEGIWANPDYWKPHPERFPQGLAPIVQRGRDLGIEVCLWFNPSKDNHYANWRRDADAMIDLHRQYGIRTFKIDGLQIESKLAEENLRRMYDAVNVAAGNDAVFNLDATAGRRGGYHSFNEYGNIFLENRYTDWGNYYPFWTLRNLWALAKYVPAENLQIEFLNVWRNAKNYQPDDPFAPAKVGFKYAFAITMFAQPLAWMEGANLPPEAMSLGDVARKYREHQQAIHCGVILPVGEEPNGESWTGLQSIVDDRGGYVEIFREHTSRPSARVKLWQAAGRKIKFTPIIGAGVEFTALADIDGGVEFALPTQWSYCLYSYSICD